MAEVTSEFHANKENDKLLVAEDDSLPLVPEIDDFIYEQEIH